MNKEIKEIKENLDFAREVFDYTLNPSQCGLILDYINQLEKKNKALLKQKNEAIIYIKNSKKLGLKYHSEETLFKMETIYRMLVGREEDGSNE